MAPPAAPAARRIAIAALLIAAGNIASRMIGLGREAVIAGLFGRGIEVAVFTAASAVPTIVYDLLINGAISAALVPVFSAYADDADDATFWRVAGGVTTIALAAVVAVTALLMWQAPLVLQVLVGGFAPDTFEHAVAMTRILLPATVFMALAGLITALLQARQRFLLPAFTTSAYNAGIIAGALAFAPHLGATSLALGVLIGAVAQVALQLPGLRGARFGWPEWDHPGVRRVLRLYAPVALGITCSVIGIVLDRNLASRLSAEVIPTMRYATTLIQLPLGLVAAAVSFAVLPTLSRLAASNDDEAFRQTLALGINVVIVLITPATVGLALLAEPLVALLYQRGAFGADDTVATARALWFYLPGLPAAAIDQMLLFAFYARQRTLLPNLVQGAAVGLYALTALVLFATTPWRIEALILGNTVQWIGHMALLALLVRPLVRLRGLQIGSTALRCAAASIPLAITAWWLQAPLLAWGGPLAALLGAGGAAALAYLGAGVALRIGALTFVVDAIRAHWLRRGPPHS